MKSVDTALSAWVLQARDKLARSKFGLADLDELEKILVPSQSRLRQKLLYLHALTTSIHSQVLSMALHEPGQPPPEITAQPVEWPYATVYDAIMDGWQVIHFPQQNAPLQDRQLDVMGYEFILQKLEANHE